MLLALSRDSNTEALPHANNRGDDRESPDVHRPCNLAITSGKMICSAPCAMFWARKYTRCA